MKTIYAIEGPWAGRLAIVARPRGGEWLADDVLRWRQKGIDVVVSLLTRQENQELGLTNEATTITEQGLLFISFPIVDRGVPSRRWDAQELVGRLTSLLTQGKNVAIHCRQGVGRSALLAAALLVNAGVGVEQAFRQIEMSRGCPAPETPEQKQWVEQLIAQEPAPALLDG